MKKITSLILANLYLFCFSQSNTGVLISDDNSNIIDPSVIFEVKSDDKGFKIPTISLGNSLADKSMIINNNPVHGLLIYNNGPNQDKGFYYWDDTQSLWIQVGATPPVAGSNCVEDVWHEIGGGGFLADGVTPVPNFNNGFQNTVCPGSSYNSIPVNNLFLLSIKKTCDGFVHLCGYLYTPQHPSQFNGIISILNLPVGYIPFTDIVNLAVSPKLSDNPDDRVYIDGNELKMQVFGGPTAAQFIYINFSYKAQ